VGRRYSAAKAPCAKGSTQRTSRMIARRLMAAYIA
jgi:hypothetical protein